MSDPYLLHIFSATRHVSPFDINMAYEARYDAVIPYADVSPEDIRDLTQDCIFSRGPKGVKRTGIFIGGRDFHTAIDMLKSAKEAMVPPFEVSVLVDPSGAITTAAAIVASVERCLELNGAGSLEGKQVFVVGGTGPVGICAGVLAQQAGASTFLVSHQGYGVARRIAEHCNERYGVDLQPADSSTPVGLSEVIDGADVMINTAKAGVQVMSRADLGRSPRLRVAADANAVPPLGFEGVGTTDFNVPMELDGLEAVGIGALGIGDVKYKVHTRLLQMMYESDKPLYLAHPEALQAAREIVTSID